MPRKRRVSSTKKKLKEVRVLRSDRPDKVDRAESEEESSGSDTTEVTDEIEIREAEPPTMKLAPIFEKMQSSKNTAPVVSPEDRAHSEDEQQIRHTGGERSRESDQSQSQASPDPIVLRSGYRDEDELPLRIEQENLTAESVRKRLFNSVERRSRETEEEDRWRVDLRAMEERLLKHQVESETRIKRANVEAYDQCRRDMIDLLDMEEKIRKKEIDIRVKQATAEKVDRSENEELKRKVARLENALEKVNDNIRIGVEHQVSSQFQIEKNKEKIKSLEELIIRKDKEIAALTSQSEISDQYTRKLNMWIYGLEGNDKDPEDTLKIVKDFVVNDLKANKNTVENWDIRHIHRVPGKKNEPSPIIVSFLKWKDKEFLLRMGKELRGHNEGKQHWVSFKHDLAKGARAARKAMGIEAASIREKENLMARVCDNAKGFVWLQTKKKREDNWETIRSYKP